jgi:hypothetical protein
MPLRLIVLLFVAASASGHVRPAVERIDAILGHPLLVPVRVDDPRLLLPVGQAPGTSVWGQSWAADPSEAGRGRTRVALDDGQTLSVAYFRLEQVASERAGWLGAAARYRALPAPDAVRRGVGPAGVWYAVIEMPLEAVTQGIWFDDDRYEINWLPDPERAGLESGGRALWASSAPPGAADSPAVRAALDALRADPFESWGGGRGRGGGAPAPGADRTGRDGTDLGALRADLAADPGGRFLGELARHHEARWQLILGRLALIDPEAAERMRRRLGGVVRLDGVWVPFWTPDSPELRALQTDLLSPWVDDQTRVLRALGWLDAQPKALAWVIDDAGQPMPGESRLHALLGLLSVPARDAPLMAELGGAAGVPTLETVPPRQGVSMRAGVPLLEAPGSGQAVRTTAVPVRIGRESASVEAVATVAGVRPPGLRIGPLVHDWTLPALLEGSAGAGALPGADGATVGVLRRVGAPNRAPEDAGWAVFLACAAPGPGEDAVTLYAGPYGLPRGVWRVARDGAVHRLFGPSDLSAVSVAETPDGWALQAELPAGMADEDGLLRIGVTRERTVRAGAGGEPVIERTAWPRRMTPGQDAPGRIPVSLDAWRGF